VAVRVHEAHTEGLSAPCTPGTWVGEVPRPCHTGAAGLIAIGVDVQQGVEVAVVTSDDVARREDPDGPNIRDIPIRNAGDEVPRRTCVGERASPVIRDRQRHGIQPTLHVRARRAPPRIALTVILVVHEGEHLRAIHGVRRVEPFAVVVVRGTWIVVRSEDRAAAVPDACEIATDQRSSHRVRGDQMHAAAKVAKGPSGNVRNVVFRAAVRAPVVNQFLGPGNPDGRVPRCIL
jgi:hypothetical protein